MSGEAEVAKSRTGNEELGEEQPDTLKMTKPTTAQSERSDTVLNTGQT